jgi:2-pyrone-4,6-dicarboxylate lactonase
VLRELGWHVELHIAIENVHDLPAYIARFGVPVVIDHMGRPTPGHSDPSSPSLRALIELVRAGECYVKLSAAYRLSAEGPPWRDVTPLARALLSANAERCLWRSDWPHPDTPVAVSDADVFDTLNDWCPDPEERRKMMMSAPNLVGPFTTP